MAPDREGNPEGREGEELDVSGVYLDTADVDEFLEEVQKLPNKKFVLKLDFENAYPSNQLNYLATNPRGMEFKITVRASREEYLNYHKEYSAKIEWE